MLLLTREKRSRMRRRYQDRQGFATLLQRDIHLRDSLPALIGITEAGFTRAEADPAEFVALFGEPMPDHLRMALHLETNAWVAIRTILDGAHAAGITPQEYDCLLPHLRQKVSTMLKILDVEREIMCSPLRNFFIDQLAALQQVQA